MSFHRMLPAFLLWLCVLPIAAGGPMEGVPPPFELLAGFFQTPGELLVVAAGDRLGALEAELDESVYAQMHHLRFLAAEQADAAQLKSSAALVVGTKASNPWLGKLAEDLPIELEDGRFRFAGRTYADLRDALYCLHPNPLDPNQALFLVLGNSVAAVAELVARLPVNDHYAVFRGDRRLRFGYFTAENGAAWTVDARHDRDFEAGVTLETSTPRFDVVVYGDATDAAGLKRLMADKDAVYERVREFLGDRAKTLPRGRLFLYPRISDKGAFANDTRIAHTDAASHESHLALDDTLAPFAWDTETVALLRSALGEPRTRALEVGLGVRLSTSWRRRGWAYWAARYQAAEMVPRLAELLDNDLLDPGVYDGAVDVSDRTYPQRASPLVYEPLTAALVDFLIESRGRAAFLEGYAEWPPSGADVDRLESGWRQHLAALARRNAASMAHAREQFPRLSGLQAGVNYTFEGMSVDSGYLSERADAELARLSTLHANAVAVVPYTYFLRKDGKASPLPFMRGPGKENDESIVHAGLEAKRLGMSVMIKPQIQGSQWVGDIEMSSAEEWDAFFEHYERWIRHYAILAEMYEFEVLSLGVEMVRTTLTQEDHWRRLISRIRRIYSGELVYSANWGSEFEQLAFWDAFDFIGVDSYYPLSDSDDPSHQELVAGARAALRRIEAVHRRFQKPVLFTEVGFISAKAPWKEPWAGHGQEVDLEHQARACEAMLEAIAEVAEKSSWIRGMYWWKWSTQGGFRQDASHVINAKPAESVVAKWFEHLRR